MKKVIIFLLLISILLLPIISAEHAQNVMIKYKEQPQTKTFRSFLTQSLPEIPQEKIRHDFGNKKSARLTTNEINELRKNPNIESIDQIPTRNIFMNNAITLTNSTGVWSTQINSNNITGLHETICIIDTGVNYTHPDLGNCYGNNTDTSCKIIGGWDYCADDTTCSSQDWDPLDQNGHGTHVSGIAAANGIIKGIAPDAKIVMIKAANSTGTLWDDDIEAGIRFCINSAEEFNISTISMSLGGGQFFDYCDDASDLAGIIPAINDAVGQNITVTVATGNNGYSDSISFPACITNATRVGSVTKASSMSSFTNRGQNFTDTLLTFGSLINSTMIQNPQGNTLGWCGTGKDYCKISGTSMSTPMAAGIITLLRQYKKLESNINLTTDYVEEILINSSNQQLENFPIINSLAAILYSDEQSPQINLISPENSHLTSPGNQTFSCNASDNLQLKNLTLNIFNSTQLIYNLTNSSPQSNSLTINTTVNLSQIDDYTWNCESYDNQSNYNQTENRTISTHSIQTTLSPTNNTYTNQNETTFNCSVGSSEELSNITFYLYENNSLIYNETTNVSNLNNYSIFNYNLTSEGEYYYNCLATDNESQTSQTENYTITYDKTSPQIIPVLPSETRTTTKTHAFTYTYSDSSPEDYCNLTLNGAIKSSFTQTLGNGIYSWNITCSDLANNTNTSETKQIEIYTASSGSGGGGGGSSPKTYMATETQTKQGVEQKMKTREVIKFKSKSNSHQLTLNQVNKDNVEITIESNPITTTLYLNSPQKINLDNDKTFDLEINLISIINNYANIYIKETNETIPTKHIFTPEINDTKKIPIITTEENESSPIISTEEKPSFSRRIKNIFKKITEFFNKISPF